ncbi:phosphatidate cytidylyltransferase [Vogesella indigofera]|uniref:phosphatidate cytidylyltransferase n=1 Tax=Vogesella indigofera TaxID=45465 RepID=UPI00234EF9E1|nr:phosphatidate cytidylyltransferase [Vogesella indigofera]MDC7712475.1 phosphatidate cytidylyltransferase [Vogesella indigofera]
MLKTRILTALGLLPLMLAALFLFNGVAWAGFSWLIIVLALWEFARMARLDGAVRYVYLAVSTAVAAGLWLQGFVAPAALMALSLLVWLLLAPCWLAKRWPLPTGWLAMLLGWLLLFPAWFAFLAWRPQATVADGLQLLAVMGLVWVADIAAYFAGKAFGKHKLAPTISPGKSWEGVAGAVVGVSLYSWLVTQWGWLNVPLSPLWLLPLAIGLTAVSVVGDLLESWFKRSAGIKDSSQLLPGHGGVYDRIDSLIAVLAVSHALRLLLV